VKKTDIMKSLCWSTTTIRVRPKNIGFCSVAPGVRSKHTLKFNAKTCFNKSGEAARFVGSNPTSAPETTPFSELLLQTKLDLSNGRRD
jgi:hypothetical protein